jgi:hypothetical protein
MQVLSWKCRICLTVPYAKRRSTSAVRFSTSLQLLFHRSQDLVKRERGERCGIVGYPVGYD